MRSSLLCKICELIQWAPFRVSRAGKRIHCLPVSYLQSPNPTSCSLMNHWCDVGFISTDELSRKGWLEIKTTGVLGILPGKSEQIRTSLPSLVLFLHENIRTTEISKMLHIGLNFQRPRIKLLLICHYCGNQECKTVNFEQWQALGVELQNR